LYGKHKEKKAAGSGVFSPVLAVLPDWADPNVPFMPRTEAEEKLKKDFNMQNGRYILRQSPGIVKGCGLRECWLVQCYARFAFVGAGNARQYDALMVHALVNAPCLSSVYFYVLPSWM
jgi:hypothetical protein